MLSFSTILLRLCVALVLGGVIGFEREKNEHNAGLRTLALVALGTALFTIISATGFANMLGQAHVQIDPTRIASYVVAGIGFLGGGVIFHQPITQKTRGLTTAATVWVIAAVGMACGAGLLLEACVVTILTLVILVGMRYIERILLPTAQHVQMLHIEGTQDIGGQLIGQVYDLCLHANVLIEKVEVHTQGEEKKMDVLDIACRTEDPHILFQLINDIKTLPGVQAAHVDLRKKALAPL